jgi:hypothetical protein
LSLTTTTGGTVALGSGTNLTDSANLTGGTNPTGTITFNLLAPDGTPVSGYTPETVTVNGPGRYSTPTGYALPATGAVIGTYQWQVSYSGDASNAAIAATAETETVTVAAPTLTSTPGSAVVIGTNTKLTDSVALAAGYNPTGYILFSLQSPTGATVDAEIVAVSGNATYNTPNGYLPTTVGTYQWVASYKGDTNNGTVTTASGSASQQVNAANTPVITATLGASILVSSTTKLSASAVLSGGVSPTGTFSFYLFAPGVTPNATNSNNVYSDTITVTRNGTYTLASGNHPGGYQPTGAGAYTWVVAYSGDSKNNAVSVTGTQTVNLASPKLTVSPGGPIQIGSGPMTASATLTGGFNPGGSILFTLTAPNGTIAYSEVVSVTSGNHAYSTQSGFVPTVGTTLPGTYRWTASYSGDANNNVVTSAATAGSEKLIAANSPAMTSKAGGIVVAGSGGKLTDSVTLTGGSSPTGTITFFLLAPGVTPNATHSNSVFSVTVTVTGAGTYSTPTGFVPTRVGVYHWVAVYSGDANNNGVSSTAAQLVSAGSRWGR